MASHRAIPVLSPPTPSHRPRLIASHRAPRHLGKVLLAVGGLVASAALIGVSGPSPKAHASTTTLSGSIGGTGITATQASFGAWRGAPITVASNFMPHATWADIADPTYGGPDYWKNSGVLVSWAVAMLPDTGGSIVTGATGAYNSYFASMGRKLVADGQGNAVIRLGWEMNGTFMLWNGVSNPTAWIAYWRQIVTTMRAVAGSHFVFDWSPGGYTGINTDALYPGDAYVDQVGMSLYDQSGVFRGPSQAVARWSEIYNGPSGVYGLKWLASFSAAHNKPMAFGEWGLTIRCDGTGGGDDPYFIQQIHNFFANNNVAWEAYFDTDMSACESHSLTAGHFPLAGALYKKLFSQPYVPVTVPVTTGTAATSSDVVRVSVNADRSTPLALNGATLNGPSYIWAQVSTANMGYVDFYLDKSTTSTPTHAETAAPYDLVGGTATTAIPFDPSTLTVGRHTLTTVVVKTTGSTTYTSSFTVGSATTSTSKPAVVTSPPVQFSTSTDRSTPRGLAGVTVSSPIYVFVPSFTGTTQVAWYVDGATTPTHTEYYFPWDLVGGSWGAALPFGASLSHGSHTVKAVLTGSFGTTTATATFTYA